MDLNVRDRLLLALAGMLVPLVILSVATFASLVQTVDTVQEILVDPVEEIDESMRLQYVLHRAVMPAGDYLIHGRTSERAKFTQLEKKVEKQFADLRSSKELLAKQREFLQRAYRKWIEARGLSLSVLAIKKPVGSRAGANTLDRMGHLLHESIGLVDRVHTIAKEELHEGGKMVGNIKQNLERTIFLVMFSGLAFMAIFGYLVVRSIIRPVRKLEEGVIRLAEGDYDRRVNVDTHDEFGRLADSFNNMATRLKTAHVQLKELSVRDGLTGIFNRRAFEQALESEIARTKRFSYKFSLAMLDIDHFKQVNDSHGHLFGDDVLIAVTGKVGKNIRPVDLFARYGGEEFVIIMPETGIEGATVSAERLRKMIEAMELKNEQDEIVRINVSFGIACLPEEAASGSELLKLADKRLYRAKSEGRNRTVSTD